jgi:hypothetical protein
MGQDSTSVNNQKKANGMVDRLLLSSNVLNFSKAIAPKCNHFDTCSNILE